MSIPGPSGPSCLNFVLWFLKTSFYLWTSYLRKFWGCELNTVSLPYQFGKWQRIYKKSSSFIFFWSKFLYLFLSNPKGAWHFHFIKYTNIYHQATTEGPCLELPEILQQYKISRSELVDLSDLASVRDVLAAFRDFCTILWLLHVRDELSLHLRRRGSQLNKETAEAQVKL